MSPGPVWGIMVRIRVRPYLRHPAGTRPAASLQALNSEAGAVFAVPAVLYRRYAFQLLDLHGQHRAQIFVIAALLCRFARKLKRFIPERRRCARGIERLQLGFHEIKSRAENRFQRVFCRTCTPFYCCCVMGVTVPPRWKATPRFVPVRLSIVT